MTGPPAWLSGLAGLDDAALTVLANRGLVRRAANLVDRLEPSGTDADEVALHYPGPPEARITLRPGGPRAASCSCPAAGVCAHIVAACLWARTVPADSPAAAPAEEPDVVAELLALDPARVNRAAGIAAVRLAARDAATSPTTIRTGAGSVGIGWPEAPEIIAVVGGGFAGMLVSGSHGDVAERAWRLRALVRLFAAHDRAWAWPDGLDRAGIVQPGQRQAIEQAAGICEALVAAGLSRITSDGADRVTAAAQRARLEALPLLGILLTRVAGRAARVAARAEDSDERDLLGALARAWGLAQALLAAEPPLPGHLVGAGRGPGEAAEVGTLIPLGLRWWLAASGARGLTVTLWDDQHGRLETVTTGRAAGSDPSFRRDWTMPLLWGVSPSTLAGGAFGLTGAERRDDGTLSATGRARAVPGARFAAEPVDLGRLATAIGRAGARTGADGFLPPPDPIRMVLPRRLRGVGRPELDEVNQQLVWPLTDRSGVRHAARLSATGAEPAVLGALLETGLQVAAVVLDAADLPVGIFVDDRGRQRLIAPSLTPPERPVRGGWWAARKPAAPGYRAHVAADDTPRHPVAEACDAVLDVCESLAATGRPELAPRQRDALERRQRQLADLGLASLAAAVSGLLAEGVTPPRVLRATVLAGRLGALARADG